MGRGNNNNSSRKKKSNQQTGVSEKKDNLDEKIDVDITAGEMAVESKITIGQGTDNISKAIQALRTALDGAGTKQESNVVIEQVLFELARNTKASTVAELGDSAVSSSVTSDKAADLHVESGAKAKELAASLPNILSARNQEDLLNKMRASAPDALLHMLPSKEVSLDMLRGTTIEEFASHQRALISISARKPRESAILKRNTEEVHLIKLCPTNLKIFTSNNGRHSVIIETFQPADIVSNIELDTQLGLRAVEYLQAYDVASPCVLRIGGNIRTEDYDAGIAFILDGLSTSVIKQAINAQRSSNKHQLMLANEIRSLALQATVIDGVGGAQITRCFDGLIKNSIIRTALATWERDIIPLIDYNERLRALTPDYYTLKRYTPLEERHGKVYFLDRRQSLAILLQLERRSCSEYFFRLIKKDIELVPVVVKQTSMISTQIGVDSKISTNQTSAGSLLISQINTSDNDRIRSLIVIACNWLIYGLLVTQVSIEVYHWKVHIRQK